jgi:hypothetical protein
MLKSLQKGEVLANIVGVKLKCQLPCQPTGITMIGSPRVLRLQDLVFNGTAVFTRSWKWESPVFHRGFMTAGKNVVLPGQSHCDRDR